MSLLKKLLLALVFTLGALAYSAVAHADVSINEVAWMGTANSQYEEWIELYNNGTEDVSLSGWKILKADGATTLFSPTKTISAGKYLLICRTTASLTSPLSGICEDNGSFGGSGLSNSGEHLQLKDAGGIVVDDLSFSSAWPAGDSTTKKTMQRTNDGGWGTGTGTPGATNEASPAENNGGTEDENTTQNPEEESQGENEEIKSSTSSVAEKITAIKPDPVYKARMDIPEFATAGVAVPIAVIVKADNKRDMVSGRFEWSMGDGSEYVFYKNTPTQHIFDYPGTYTIIMTYYSNEMKEEPDSLHRKTITIAPDSVDIVEVMDDGGITIKNNSTKEINLAGWMISVDSNQSVFRFPKNTIITKGQELSISSRTLRFKISVGQKLELLNPSGFPVSSFSPQ